MKTKKKKGFRESTGAAEVLAGLLEKRSAGVVRRWQKRHFAVGVLVMYGVFVMLLLNCDAIRSSAGTTSTTLRTRTLRS